MSTANHPQTDGQSENANKEVITALRHFCNSFKDDWDECLAAQQFAHNDATHSSTGLSPFKALYGFQPHTPTALAADAPSARPSNHADFLTHIQAIHRQAKAAIAHAQRVQAAQANKTRRDLTLPVGSYAWVSRNHIHPPHAAGAVQKLGPLWFGPYLITAAPSNVTYTLALPPHMKYYPTIHVSHLKPYVGTTTPLQVRNPPPPQVVDGEDHFHVETFLQTRGGPRGRSFFVKWQGYPEDEATWEPETRLRQDLSPDDFAHFYAHLQARLARTRRPRKPGTA
jgi:hypothetical protein